MSLISLVILSAVFFFITYIVARKNISFTASNKKSLNVSDGIIEASTMGLMIMVIGLILDEALNGLTVGMLISLGMTAALVLITSVAVTVTAKGDKA